MIKNHLHAAFLRQVTYFILVVTHRVWKNLRVYQLVQLRIIITQSVSARLSVRRWLVAQRSIVSFCYTLHVGTHGSGANSCRVSLLLLPPSIYDPNHCTDLITECRQPIVFDVRDANQRLEKFIQPEVGIVDAQAPVFIADGREQIWAHAGALDLKKTARF
jgi:hypothetical protein